MYYSPNRGGVEERLDESRGVTRSSKSTLPSGLELFEVFGAKVGDKATFDPSPKPFDGVALWGVRRGVDEGKAMGKVLFNEGLGFLGLMNPSVITKDHQVAWDGVGKVLQEGCNLGGFDAMGVGLLEDLALCSDSPDGGKVLPVTAGLEDGGLTDGCPSPTQQTLKARTHFVKKDVAHLFFSFNPLFTPGRVSANQAWIAASSRSAATRWAFWGLHPSLRSTTPMWSGS